MKCHYEVLEIPRDADDSQIKTAYRKLALKWHPDKNLDNGDHAKEQFQLVQQAYEVLSDRQERAWYDSHREQILCGGNSEFEDKSLDVFQYFTTTCFKGYSDDDDGFYAVYRRVFEDITREDIEYMENKEELCEIPHFGSSTSDYDEVVGPFYAHWTSYTTKKSYVWLDPYNIQDTRDRRIFKLMEKENKKIRQKAKKERNEEVRALVAFVRKRDKRVQENSKKMEARIMENRQKQEELSRQKRLERKQQLDETKPQADWTKFDNVISELEEIEKKLAAEFGEQLAVNGAEGSSVEPEPESLYCIACNKVFKTPQAFQNHEFSKKHKENVEKMKGVMLDDEDEADEDEDEDDEADEEDKDEHDSSSNSKPYSDSESFSSTSSDNRARLWRAEQMTPTAADEQIGNKAKKKLKKSKRVIRKYASEEEDEKECAVVACNLVSDSDKDFSFNSNRKRKLKKGSSKTNTTLNSNISNSHTNHYVGTSQIGDGIKEIKQKKMKKLRNKHGTKDTEIPTVDTNHCCVTCKTDFPTKNKLFDHLKKSGHSVYLPQIAKIAKNKKTVKE